MLQKSNQRNKYLGSPSCKILGTILRINKGGTQTYRQREKKVDDYAQSFTSER